MNHNKITSTEFITPKSAAEARAMQDALRKNLKLQDDFGQPNTITGVDVGYDIKQGLAHASVATLSLDGLKVLEQAQALTPVDFPYIPGLLSFREIPAILAALAKLSRQPELLMVDGQGIAHPRRMGIAAHLGILLDIPSLGVAKSRLTGNFTMPDLKKGDSSALMHGSEQIGVVLRSRDGVKPLFISPGHRMSLETAMALTMRCLTRYRLPEPTRIADKFSKCGKGRLI